MEKQTGKKFGGPQNPLLVSCRSGAKFSMPGMMDTILNLGLNDETAAGLIEMTGNERFVYDSYRRLIQMFGTVVMGIPDEAFEEKMSALPLQGGRKNRCRIKRLDLKAIDARIQADLQRHTGQPFPASLTSN